MPVIDFQISTKFHRNLFQGSTSFKPLNHNDMHFSWSHSASRIRCRWQQRHNITKWELNLINCLKLISLLLRRLQHECRYIWNVHWNCELIMLFAYSIQIRYTKLSYWYRASLHTEKNRMAKSCRWLYRDATAVENLPPNVTKLCNITLLSTSKFAYFFDAKLAYLT